MKKSVRKVITAWLIALILIVPCMAIFLSNTNQIVPVDALTSAFDLLVCCSAANRDPREHDSLEQLDLHCPSILINNDIPPDQPWPLMTEMDASLPRKFDYFITRVHLPYSVLLHAAASMNISKLAVLDFFSMLSDAVRTPLRLKDFMEFRRLMRQSLRYVEFRGKFGEQSVFQATASQRKNHEEFSMKASIKLFNIGRNNQKKEISYFYSKFLPQGSGVGVETRLKYFIFIHSSPIGGSDDEEKNIVTHEILHYILRDLWTSDVNVRRTIAATEEKFALLGLSPRIRSFYGTWDIYLQEIIVRAAASYINRRDPFPDTLPLESCWREYFQQSGKEPTDLAIAIREIYRNCNL